METNQIEIPKREKRRFLPDDLKIDSWEKLEPYFKDLKEREIKSVEDLNEWIKDRSELEAVLEEDLAWRYIKMNIDTTDEKLAEDFKFFISEIQPKVEPYNNAFNEKMMNSTAVKELDQEKYFIYLRAVKKALEVYREENIPLHVKQQTEQQKYGNISAQMTITYKGEELTMQKAASYMKDPDRKVREEVFKLIVEKRKEESEKLHQLYTELIGLRQEIAENADFKNFRDYKFASMGRFDYTPEDCFEFHHAIREEIVPLLNEFDKERKAAMKLEALKPWDTDVDPQGRGPLKPFDSGEQLVDKTIECFTRVRPFFGECLHIMREMGHLDLESKKGKAPGGFNYPLYEIGVPFIFMNSVGTFRDMITMIHEGGHAVHSFLSRDLEITSFKELTSEVAELASMSMELITMDNWDVFFDNEEELNRAKMEHLEKVVSVLPWVATIDKFQHWIYENPKHSVKEREENWLRIFNEFRSDVVDWSDFDDYQRILWQKQLHLYEVPFYYIEYGIAQLGAIAVWKNYKENPQKALDQYQEALSLGYTQSIGDIYETAGIRFDFSKGYVHELMEFVRGEMGKVK